MTVRNYLIKVRIPELIREFIHKYPEGNAVTKVKGHGLLTKGSMEYSPVKIFNSFNKLERYVNKIGLGKMALNKLREELWKNLNLN